MTVREAPLNRTMVDTALPWHRGLFGLCFVAFSAASTITIGAADLMYLFSQSKTVTIGGASDAYWYSCFAAFVFFAGEVATSERYRRAYLWFLIPDAFYTARGVFWGIAEAITQMVVGPVSREQTTFLGGIQASPAQAVGFVAAFFLSAVAGYFIAKWGEVLLFGKRRKISGAVIRKEAA